MSGFASSYTPNSAKYRGRTYMFINVLVGMSENGSLVTLSVVIKCIGLLGHSQPVYTPKTGWDTIFEKKSHRLPWCVTKRTFQPLQQRWPQINIYLNNILIVLIFNKIQRKYVFNSLRMRCITFHQNQTNLDIKYKIEINKQF